MKKYILCNSNGDVLDVFDTKKQVRQGIKGKMKDELECYGMILNGKITDYEVWSIKYNARKFYPYWAFSDFSMLEKKTDEFVEYDDYKSVGIIDKREKKDFLYYFS